MNGSTDVKFSMFFTLLLSVDVTGELPPIGSELINYRARSERREQSEARNPLVAEHGGSAPLILKPGTRYDLSASISPSKHDTCILKIQFAVISHLNFGLASERLP
jgi:hypothetical protein